MRKIKTLLIFAALFSMFAGCSINESPKSATPNLNGKSAAVRVSAAAADAAEPNVAVDADNNVYVVWVEHGGDKRADVFMQKYSLDLKPIGDKVRVNPEAGTATAWRGDAPTIAVGADKALFVGWTAPVDSASGHGNDLLLSASRDGGKTFAAPTKVNDDKLPAAHGMHSLAIDKSGKVYVAWLDERYLKTQAAKISNDNPPSGFYYEKAQHQMPAQHGEANREMYFAASNDNGKTFAPNKRLAGDVCPCCKTALFAAPDNKIYAAWRQVLPGEFRHIAVAASGDGGANFTAPSIVSDDRWQISGCPVSGASLGAGKNNALKVLWFTAGANGTTGIYQAESTDGGAHFSERQLVGAGAVFGTPVLLSKADQSNEFVWSANGKLFAAAAANAQTAPEIETGDLPSAALANGKTIIAFIKKESDKRSIWLLLSEPPA